MMTSFQIGRIRLTHGQARWVLAQLGLHAGGDALTFDNYLKSIRRDGVPFGADELGIGTGHNLTYRYEHVMELAVALALRTQGILSRDVVALLAQFRPVLRPLYRQAWLFQESGLGARREVTITGEDRTRTISGVYLDLNLIYTDRGILNATEPRLLSPVEAFDAYMAGHQSVYPRPPIPVSQIAADVVRLAECAPEIRRGRAS
jgi:hypothetical protein